MRLVREARHSDSRNVTAREAFEEQNAPSLSPLQRHVGEVGTALPSQLASDGILLRKASAAIRP
jgi:hypothetical protein